MIYKIASSGWYEQKEIAELEEKVNQLISEGYEPVGGVSVRLGTASGAYFVQSMVKPEPTTCKR